MFDFFLPKEALVRCVMMMQNWELLDVPEDGEAPPCADDDAAAKDESQGMVNNCKEAGEKGLCEHATIGPLAQGLCPVTCGTCPAKEVDCKDDDAAAKDESQGMVNNCKEAGEQGLCEHATIGPLAQGLCPVTCRKCPKAGNTRRAGPIDAYYGWRGIPECNFGGSPCSIRIG